MKAMTAEDLKTKTGDELAKILVDMKKQQFNLRIQKSQGQMENTAQIRKVRRNIARVNMFIGAQDGDNAVSMPKKAKASTTKAKTKAGAKPVKKAAAPKAKKSSGKKAAAKE